MGASNVLHTQSGHVDTFLRDIRTDKGTYTNGSGSEATLAEGTVLGQITSTGKWTPCKSTATDGSQNPRRVLFAEVTVANGDSVDLSMCIAGDVNKDKLVFALGGDSLDTVIYQNLSSPTTDQIALGRMGTLLVANSHIMLVDGVDNTFADNTAS